MAVEMTKEMETIAKDLHETLGVSFKDKWYPYTLDDMKELQKLAHPSATLPSEQQDKSRAAVDRIMRANEFEASLASKTRQMRREGASSLTIAQELYRTIQTSDKRYDIFSQSAINRTLAEISRTCAEAEPNVKTTIHFDELLDTSHPLPKEVSMLTVAKGQGKYGELMKAVRHIRKGARVEHPFESPFVDSAIDELSCCHGSGRMTFLSDVSLLDAMEIAQAIHKEEKLEKATGTITLDKHTVCGLFDPTGQAGSSLLGVMLEKPLKLKLKDLTLADDRMFDRKNECYPWRSWSATEVFGLCKDAWRKETISAFKPMTPKQLKKAQLEQASTR